ncbi:2-hydroxycarboxylate transporter family protein [Paraburkholderia tropica]|uniref:2-hydroxycarboxylate transporter family protein n=1 Tax=Paraburkholderia tropica TaxID=92647 RepID=UPI0038B898B7
MHNEAQHKVTNQKRDHRPRWLHVWWKIMDVRVGIIPLPVYVLLIATITTFVLTGKLPSEISVAIAVLALCGFTCAELGKRVPGLKKFGTAAIVATFLPSFLAYRHFLPEKVLATVDTFTHASNFMYLFIASIIVGSVFSMDRRTLMRGFIRIVVPLGIGALAAAITGTLVGTLLGLGWQHTLLYIVLPMMAGGVGEGAIPLSMGYSEIFHLPQGQVFAQLLPAIMISSLTAILLAGLLNWLGEKRPHWTGNGVLERQPARTLEPEDHVPEHPDSGTIAAAAITAITLYLVGLLCHRLFSLPAPVAMLFIAVLVKLCRLISPSIESGARVVYQFFSTAVTYPLLFAIGTAMTPWSALMSALTVPVIVTIVCTVVTLVLTGFLVGRVVNLHPIDTAIITACHSGQGGTGDVAILTASNRMSLMPFAQIATRIGGAITVTGTLLVLTRLH